MSNAKRDELDSKQIAHVEEFMAEKHQYYSACSKAVANPDKCLSIIMDAMDKSKTRVPFFKTLQNQLHRST